MHEPALETRLSVVIPVHDHAGTVESLLQRLHEHLATRYDLEVVLVNDGSPRDGAAALCRRLAVDNPAWVRFLDLARNFGAQSAVIAGLGHCTGDFAVIMDDDPERQVADVVGLVEKCREGHDAVYVQWEQDRRGWLRDLCRRCDDAIASVVLRKPGGLRLSPFKVVNRCVIDEITRYQGPLPYVDGLILRATRNVASLRLAHGSGRVGRSGSTIGGLFRLWLDTFSGLWVLPLRLASLLGLVFAILGLGFAIAVIIEWINTGTLPSGWAATVCVLLVVTGVQIFFLGMVGEYLCRLFGATSQYVVRERVNCTRPVATARKKQLA